MSRCLIKSDKCGLKVQTFNRFYKIIWAYLLVKAAKLFKLKGEIFVNYSAIAWVYKCNTTVVMVPF